MAQKLFDQVAVNANSGSWVKPDTGILTVFAWGTFDGATVKLQFSPDGVEWFDDPIAELVFTSKSLKTQRVSVGVHIRAVLSNVGTSTNVSLWLL